MATSSRSVRPTSVAERSKVGFAGVAEWIALDPGNEPFIFRKFDELSARNLLYLQAEVITIEEQLFKIDYADATSRDMARLRLARIWETPTDFTQGALEMGDRISLILELRKKLKEYHKALLQQSEIAKLKKPGHRTVEAFSQWLERSYWPLGGNSSDFLSKGDDLVTLRSAREVDYLSTLMQRYWPTKATNTNDTTHGIGRFEEKNVAIAVAILNILVAAILLVGSITTLYFVEKEGAKLGLVAIFTALFALSIGLMTNARRAEIFAATAA